MHNLTQLIPKRKRKILVDWKHGMPWCVTENSAFFFRLAQASLGRSLVFRKGVIEENPRLRRAFRISEKTVIIHFVVSTVMQVSGIVGYKMPIDEIQVIARCSVCDIDKKLSIQILHSISTREIDVLRLKLGWDHQVKLEYLFQPFERSDGFKTIRILGVLHRYDIFRQYGGILPADSWRAVDKVCVFRPAKRKGMVRRLS